MVYVGFRWFRVHHAICCGQRTEKSCYPYKSTTVHYGEPGSRIPPWQWFVRKQVDLSCPILSYLVLCYPVLPDPLRSNLYVIYLSIYGSICVYESTVNLCFCMSTYVSKHPSIHEQSIGMFTFLFIYLYVYLFGVLSVYLIQLGNLQIYSSNQIHLLNYLSNLCNRTKSTYLSPPALLSSRWSIYLSIYIYDLHLCPSIVSVHLSLSVCSVRFSSVLSIFTYLVNDHNQQTLKKSPSAISIQWFLRPVRSCQPPDEFLLDCNEHSNSGWETFETGNLCATSIIVPLESLFTCSARFGAMQDGFICNTLKGCP